LSFERLVSAPDIDIGSRVPPALVTIGDDGRIRPPPPPDLSTVVAKHFLASKLTLRRNKLERLLQTFQP
jgi:hypothetical protein